MDTNAEAAPRWWVICLCAEWCSVCREWRVAFNEQAAAHPDIRFAWVDVEDEADAMGDVDIETFPTLMVALGGKPLFFGPVQPSGTQFTRLVANLRESGESPSIPADAQLLLARLHAGVLPN